MRIPFLLAAFAVALVSPVPGQVTEEHAPQPVIGNSAVCRFSVTGGVSYENGQIVHAAPEKEKEPIVMYFSDLNKRRPKLRSVDAKGTEGPLRTLRPLGNDDKVVLMEVTPEQKNVFVYTIHRELGVATWTKQYEIRSVPLALVSMGRCESGSAATASE
jgi:hypothetical protein